MDSSNHYPVFLALAGRACIVAGLGQVGLRKLRGLLACDAESVLALDTRLPGQLAPELAPLLEDRRVRFESRRFREEDAKTGFLVFAATADPEENLRISELCKKWRALCNCVTEPEKGDFILPATARQGRLCAALSTDGQSPLLARQWRLELEDWLKPREKLAWLMGRLRPPVLALGMDYSHNSMIFRKIATSRIPEWLENNELAKCQSWLESELPAVIHPELALVFAEFANAFA